MSAAGAWFVTPHAVGRYRERVPGAHGLAYEEILARLVDLSRTSRRVRQRPDGAWVWRGPKPLRIRCVVNEAVGDGLPQLITVLPLFRGE